MLNQYDSTEMNPTSWCIFMCQIWCKNTEEEEEK